MDDTAGNCITTVSSADTCQLNSTALECGSNNFRASSCLCKPGSTDNRNCQLTGILKQPWLGNIPSKVLFAAFVPFGIGNGDSVGPQEIDASTKRVLLSDPVVFYRREQTDLFVSLKPSDMSGASQMLGL